MFDMTKRGQHTQIIARNGVQDLGSPVGLEKAVGSSEKRILVYVFVVRSSCDF